MDGTPTPEPTGRPDERRPVEPPADPVVRVLGTVQALGEPLVALALAFLATTLLTLPLLQLRVDFPLRPARSDSIPELDDDELVRRIRALEVAEAVVVAREGSRKRLVLKGVGDLGAALGPVRGVIEAAGYERTLFWPSPDLDPAELIGADPDTLPRILAIQAVVFTLLGLALIRWRVGRVPGRRRSGPLATVGLGLGGGVAAIVFSSMASAALKLVGLSVEEQPWIQDLLADPGAIMRLAPWIVLVVPVAEEIFFRGYVFRFVGQRLGFALALAFSSCVFAAIHLNPSGFVIYVVIAGVLAWVYERSGRLMTPIIAHATLNAFVLLVGALAPQAS